MAHNFGNFRVGEQRGEKYIRWVVASFAIELGDGWSADGIAEKEQNVMPDDEEQKNKGVQCRIERKTEAESQ
jgi:hypothetical protein